MLKYLDLNKKRAALLGAAPALAAAAGLWLFRSQVPWWDLGLILGVVWLILCLNYGLCGIALGLKWLVGLLILLAGIALTVFIGAWAKGIAWLSEEEITSLGTLITIPFMLFVPGCIQQRVRDHLEGSSAEEVDRLRQQMGLPAEADQPMSYDQWIGNKQLLNLMDDGAAFPTTAHRVLHSILSGLVAASGLFLILLGYFRIESIRVGPWVLLAGLGLIITAPVLLYRGYRIGLLTLTACALAELAGWGALEILSRAWESSKPLFAGLCALLSLALVLGFIALLRQANRKYNPLMTIAENNWILRLDPDLRILYPVEHYHLLIRGVWQLKVGFDLDRFHDEIHRFTLERRLVVGLTRQSPQGKLELMVYGRTQRQVNALKKWLLRRIPGISLSQTTDPEWAAFRAELPTDETMIRYHNGLIWQDLSDHGYPVDEAGPMVLTAAFADASDAHRMMEALRREPHDEIEYEDNRGQVEEEALDPDLSHLVHLTKTFRLSKAWLDIETLRFQAMAQSLGGSYESLGLVDPETQPPGEPTGSA